MQKLANGGEKWELSGNALPQSAKKARLFRSGLFCKCLIYCVLLAEWTGLEPATPGVTGRYSNQLNYHSMQIRFVESGVPYEIRTRVIAVKGRCPRPLDEGD